MILIYDFQTLKIKYKNISNLSQKISNECKKNNLIRIKRGLYTDDLNKDSPLIANMCYGPSYLSFEYALSYYGLIPEHVSVYTSACFNKKNNKLFTANQHNFEYRSIPDEVFSYGVEYQINENGTKYKIASKEKALCDMLYTKYPVRTIGELKVMLFEDLRVDEDMLCNLNFNFILSIVPLYHSNTLLTLEKLIREIRKNGIN